MSVLLLSGGLDSAVLLAREVQAGARPICLNFNYGQRHVRERSPREPPSDSASSRSSSTSSR